jgi:hypothetical protein
MAGEPRHVQINTSAIPVAGIGGVGMLAIAAIFAASFPLARWVLVSGAAGGALMGVAMILVRRREPCSADSTARTISLFRS